MIYLGIGSNLGNRIKNITKAKYFLDLNGINITKSSSYYETLSWPDPNKPVVQSNTKASPEKLLKIFKSTSIGYLDKLLGFFFGVFRVFVLACIIYIYTLMTNEREDFPEYTKDSKTLPLIEKLSVMLTDNFEFFNETQMQDIINSDNNNESIENE